MKKALPIDILTGYRRLFGFPLDEDSVKYSLEDAQKYARSSRSYTGQILTVVTEDEDNNTIVTPYKVIGNTIEPILSDYYSIKEILDKNYIQASNESIRLYLQPGDNDTSKVVIEFTSENGPSVNLVLHFKSDEFSVEEYEPGKNRIKLNDSIRANIDQVPTNVADIAQLKQDVADINVDIAAEISRAKNKENEIDQKLTQEIADREGDVASLTSKIDTADAALGGRIDALDQKIDDAIGGTEADFNEKLEALDSKIEEETARATLEEEGIQTQVDTHGTRLTALENKDTTLDQDIANLSDRIDQTNENLTSEASTRLAEDTALSQRITANANDISGLEQDLESEVTRATSAESTLTTNLEAEVTRATGAEEALGGRIDDVEESAFYHANISEDKSRLEFLNNADTLVASIELKDLGLVLDNNSTNGIIYLKDSKGNIITQTDTVEEKILKSATFNEATEKLILTFYDDSVVEIPLSSMTNKIKYYYGDGSTIVLDQVVENGETKNVFSISDAYKALIAKITPTETRVGTLESNLSAEVSTRESEVSRIEGLLTTESATRAEDDAILQGNINALESRSVIDSDVVYDTNGRVTSIKDSNGTAKEIAASRANADASGNVISDTYLRKDGDTFTGDLTSNTSKVSAPHIEATARLTTSLITSTTNDSDKTHSLEIKNNGWKFNEVTGVYTFAYTTLNDNNVILKLSPTELVYSGGSEELVELLKVTNAHITYKGSELALDSKFNQYVLASTYNAGMLTKQDNLTAGVGIDITNNVVKTVDKASVLIVEQEKINTVDYFEKIQQITVKNLDFPIILLKRSTSNGAGYQVFGITSTSSNLIVATSFTEYTDNNTSTVMTTTLTISQTMANSSVVEELKEVYTKSSVDNIKADLESQITQKQNILVAGTNITITGTTISAKDTTYEQASNTVAGINKFYDNDHKGTLSNDDGAISPLAVKNYVESLNYITSQYLTDPAHPYATQQWVLDKAYLTEVPSQYKTLAENDARYLQIGQTPEHGVTTNTQQNISAEKSFSNGISITSNNDTETMSTSNKVKMLYNSEKKCLVFKFE